MRWSTKNSGDDEDKILIMEIFQEIQFSQNVSLSSPIIPPSHPVGSLSARPRERALLLPKALPKLCVYNFVVTKAQRKGRGGTNSRRAYN